MSSVGRVGRTLPPPTAAIATATAGEGASPGALAFARGTAEGTLVVAVTALEVDDGIGRDLQGRALLAVAALELAGLEATLDEDLVALAQALGDPLGAVTPDADAEPVGLLDPLAGLLVLGALVDGDVELGHRAIARRVAHLRVATRDCR